MARLAWKALGRVVGASLMVGFFYLWILAIIAISLMLGMN
jgi:hypothetical protein